MIVEQTNDLSQDYLKKVDAWWRAANYLSVGQLYLLDNPLLKEPLAAEHVKEKVVGHWGTIAGQNFIYAHLNRVINKYDLDMFYIEGPGHGGQVMVSNSYLDGSYSEIYPNISQDTEGMKKLFKQFSFPGGVGSHAAPETPGSIHEGGELGYSIAHAVGAILDHPDLIAATVVGDGEAETGPLATSWQSNKFIDPITDGAVLPILHLNGYKISNPTVLARIPHEELQNYFEGLGWDPIFVEGEDPEQVHPIMAAALDKAIEKIRQIQQDARKTGQAKAEAWPMIVLRTPKGWTGPETWDGEPIEGTFRSHQVPIPVSRQQMEHADRLVEWLKSYQPDGLFTEEGKLKEEIAEIAPKGPKRMAKNPVTNGGKILQELRLPDYRDYAADNADKGRQWKQDMTMLGEYLEEVLDLNETARNFRLFGPDETMSNRLAPVFEETSRQWEEVIKEPQDEFLAPEGRVLDSLLSEHMAEGWLEGYLLTGRHGIFASYEGFLRIVDTMITQHAKWMKLSSELPWRADIASLNIVATSHVWQQDHNGYTHQEPGILGHLADKKSAMIREYLPADGNVLLAVMDKVLRSRQKINLIVASKQPRQQWFSIEEAAELVENGLGIVEWASTDKGAEPDIVIAAAGDTPTLESLATIQLLHERLPELKIRFINVVDLLRLAPPEEDPRGMTAAEFDLYFTKDKPVIFAFHGYPKLIQSLLYNRCNRNVSVHGYQEEGAITTPFDMRVRNKLDRFSLMKDAVLHLPHLGNKGAHIIQEMNNKLSEHYHHIRDTGIDLPEVDSCQWKALD